VVNVDTTGKILTWVSGSVFDPTMAGSFIDVAGQSATVQTVTSGTSLTLQNGIAASQLNQAYTANGVPHSIKQAILIHAAHLYQNRESYLVDSDFTETPLAARSLLDQYRNFHAIQEND